MGDLFLLSERQMARISPFFPLAHGVPRVDDRRVVSGIVYVIRNGLQWKDAPKGYGPHKTLYNRFIRWSRLGVFDRIFAALAGEGPRPERIMIDSTHLKAHRTAASLLKKGLFPVVSGARSIGRATKSKICLPSSRLAAHRNTLRPLRSHLLLGNLYRSSRRLLSQSIKHEPRCGKLEIKQCRERKSAVEMGARVPTTTRGLEDEHYR